MLSEKTTGSTSKATAVIAKMIGRGIMRDLPECIDEEGGRAELLAMIDGRMMTINVMIAVTVPGEDGEPETVMDLASSTEVEPGVFAP